MWALGTECDQFGLREQDVCWLTRSSSRGEGVLREGVGGTPGSGGVFWGGLSRCAPGSPTHT